MTIAAKRLANEQVPDFDSLIEHVGHLLPSQAPIRRFVHHNTLHAFEHLHFEEAVVEAAKLFDTEPFPTEAFFKKQWEDGRITVEDLDSVLPQDDEQLSTGDWTRREFRLFRLQQFLPVAAPAKVKYEITEGGCLEKIHPAVSEEARKSLLDCGEEAHTLKALWEGLSKELSPQRIPQDDSKKKLVAQTVHPLMIRFCGVYLDQGIAYWPILREGGFYRTFLSLFSQSAGPVLPWMKGLKERLQCQIAERWNAEKALEQALRQLGYRTEQWEQACLDRALALRGWAGMIHQLEHRPDLAPIAAPPCRLIDYLAVYFQLEAHLDTRYPQANRKNFPRHEKNLSLLHEAFLLAQFAGLGPNSFGKPQDYKDFLDEVVNFHEIERRRYLFLAFEHHYVVSVLDSLQGHHEQGEYRRSKAPRFQSVFCIDDREESLRRHLEELSPEMETFGYAGFYNVPMAYQSLDDVHSRPLCPVAIQPRHLVREVATDEDTAGKRAGRMKGLGLVSQTARAQRTGMIGGFFMNSLVGFLAGIPLVGKTLFPGLARELTHTLEHTLVGRVPTRLAIERSPEEPPNEDGYFEGFTVDEMTDIVAGAMKTMGAVELAPLFIVVGHGSSSLNNPHEAAYNCGAASGGLGGPNARAFSAMANHPEVRKGLAQRGYHIPEQTWFVGGYHNTCDDTMDYYDVDLIPEHLVKEFEDAKALLHRACVLDAHERCRRFENVPTSCSPEQAYQHVLARAENLAQTRPEYGHCTNSLCIVGRRDRSRGVFLDRRAFLVSYNPELDENGEILAGLLQSVGPVGAGINLEYLFSAVDRAGYGSGTKLPHNVTGLIGVMDGYSSDLRTGLTSQMIEIHEPMRLLNIVEAEPERILKILEEKEGLRALVVRGWILLAAQSPKNGDFWVYRNGKFEAHRARNAWIETVDTSIAHYKGRRDHLPCAQVRAGLREAR